jgi:hypothetical protein
VQTLHLLPFRIDVTPFIPLLTDGKPHTISIGMNGDDVINSFWVVYGTLLYTVDEGTDVVTGKVTSSFKTHIGSGLRPKVDSHTNGTVTVVNVAYRADWAAEAVLETSAGSVNVYSSGEISFDNSQYFDIKGNVFVGAPNSHYINEVYQNSFDILNSTNGIRQLESLFNGDFQYLPGSRLGTFSQFTLIDFAWNQVGVTPAGFWFEINDHVRSQDTLLWTDAGVITGNEGTSSSQVYRYNDFAGNGWWRNVTSVDNIGVSEQTRKNNLAWWCDPYLGYNTPPPS